MSRPSFIIDGPPMTGRCVCGVDLERMVADGYLGHACGQDRVSARIDSGQLPMILEGADWKRYAGPQRHAADWQGFCDAWRAVAWVRCQAFQREGEAEWAADDYG